MVQEISELRQRIPASVSMCRKALVTANGKAIQAYDLIVQWLTDDFVSRTGVSRDQAIANLTATGFDIERSVEQWRRESPKPELSPREKLAAGMELVASIPHENADFRRFAHIIPISGGFELRLITHLAQYTEDSYGWDYDLAMLDPSTRFTREYVPDIQAAIIWLSYWGVSEDSLINSSEVNSCLVNSPLEAYLELPHLTLPDESIRK